MCSYDMGHVGTNTRHVIFLVFFTRILVFLGIVFQHFQCCDSCKTQTVELGKAERCKFSYCKILSLLWEMRFPTIQWVKKKIFFFHPSYGVACSSGFLNIPQLHACNKFFFIGGILMEGLAPKRFSVNTVLLKLLFL